MVSSISDRTPMTIGLFTPSSPLLHNYRVESLLRGVSILREWGFRVTEPTKEQLSGWKRYRSSAERADEFHALLENDEIDVLLSTWGGKTCNELLPLIDYDLVQRSRKPILGVSDVAVLLNAVYSKTGLVTFYGPNIAGKLHETMETHLPLLKARGAIGRNLIPDCSYEVVREGTCVGVLVGGSLGTYTIGLAGTEFYPQTPKSILFWETGSLAYEEIRQHLQKLKLVGALKSVVGVLVGNCAQISDFGLLDKYLSEFFSPPTPILRGDFLGHGLFPNPTLPIGATVRLDASGQSLILLEEVTERNERES